MKIIVAVFLFAFCCAAGFAQDNSVEREFEKNKSKYKLEKYSEGEDASSGYDYFVYKDKGKIIKIREIWSSSAVSTYRNADYFFKDGKLIALIKNTFDKKYYKTSLRGVNVPLKLVEKLYFTDSKLATWIEKNKTVEKTDKRWGEKETEGLESGKNILEMYDLLKK
jgi:hypothetical protein